MTRRFSHWFAIAAAVTLTTVAVAHPPEDARRGDGPPRGEGSPRRGGPPEGHRGGPRGLPPLPVLQALDADKDGEISTEEIANASAALKKLDKDDDGKLTRKELMPDFAAMRGRGRFAAPGDRPGHPRGREGDRPRGPRPEGARRGPPPEAGAMVERIMSFDKDDDGKLTGDEIPERMKRMVSRIDTNDDKVIDRGEVEQMLRRRGGPQDAGRRRRGGDRPDGPRSPRDRQERRSEADAEPRPEADAEPRAEADGEQDDA